MSCPWSSKEGCIRFGAKYRRTCVKRQAWYAKRAAAESARNSDIVWFHLNRTFPLKDMEDEKEAVKALREKETEAAPATIGDLIKAQMESKD